MPARRISRLRVKELHAAGKADGEIAALLGCARSTVRAVRLLLRLKTNDRRYRGWTGREEKELATALSDGERYADIARRLGRTYASVALKALKLELVGEGRGRPTPTGILIRAWDAFARGLSAPAVAGLLGCHRKTAWKYRRRMPADWHPRTPEAR